MITCDHQYPLTRPPAADGNHVRQSQDRAKGNAIADPEGRTEAVTGRVYFLLEDNFLFTGLRLFPKLQLGQVHSKVAWSLTPHIPQRNALRQNLRVWSYL